MTQHLIQRSPAWFSARKGRLTGSNVGAALGVNPWKTPEDLIRQMVREYHGAESEFTGNVATEHGAMHEPLAMMDYFGHTNIMPEGCGFFPHEDWLGASPDGLIEDSHGRGVIEVKCPFGLRNKQGDDLVFKSAAEQPHYFAQMQIEMLCAGVEFCDFFQWTKHGSQIDRVYLDQRWIDKALPELRRFYDLYLSERDNPAHLQPKEREINTHHALKLVQEWDTLKAVIDDAEARKKEIMAALVQISKERNAIIHGHKLTQVERKGNVNYAKIPELKGLDLEQYRGKSSQFWQLR